MTRNEAFNKLKIVNRTEFLDGLEALGLIKFDEEIKVPPPASIIALEINDFTSIPHCLSDKIIDALAKYGYQIVRK